MSPKQVHSHAATNARTCKAPLSTQCHALKLRISIRHTSPANSTSNTSNRQAARKLATAHVNTLYAAKHVQVRKLRIHHMALFKPRQVRELRTGSHNMSKPEGNKLPNWFVLTKSPQNLLARSGTQMCINIAITLSNQPLSQRINPAWSDQNSEPFASTFRYKGA